MKKIAISVGDDVLYILLNKLRSDSLTKESVISGIFTLFAKNVTLEIERAR